MQYTQLLLVPCPLAFVLCIMHTVYSFFVGLFILCVVFAYALFCIMYARYNEQRGRGGCFVCSVRGVGEGGIEVGVRRRYPTSTPRAIFNSPGHSTLLTIHLPYGIIQLHQSPPFGLVDRCNTFCAPPHQMWWGNFIAAIHIKYSPWQKFNNALI